MRQTLYGIGWILLLALPLIYGIQIVISQDLPPVEWWQWAILLATVLVIYFSRNRDDVLKHHVV